MVSNNGMVLFQILVKRLVTGISEALTLPEYRSVFYCLLPACKCIQ
jgi:hypothetical protein